VLSIDGLGGSIAGLPVFDGASYPASATAIDGPTLPFVSKPTGNAFIAPEHQPQRIDN
jgi:hypothetical protein